MSSSGDINPLPEGGVIRIDPVRMLADMAMFRSFGAQGTGVVRRAFSKADVASREWLSRRLEEAGLTVAMDRFGNVFGCDPRCERAILVGSHGDTQPTGGWLDGAMGVIIALEVARAAQECGFDAPLGIDAVCWSDEEARFGHFLGSRAYCGLLSDEEALGAVDDGGIRLPDAIASAGYASLPACAVDRSRHAAYLEPHIEQGPVLDSEALQLGVVDAIVGAREFLVIFEGQANHAGTTPMVLRRDAALAMIQFAAALDMRFASLADGKIVWTFGKIVMVPNAPSIVPAGASITIQFRGPTLDMLDRFEGALMDELGKAKTRSNAVACSATLVLDYRPTPLDPAMIDAVAQAAERVAPGRWRLLPSGAGHDAQFLAPLMPTGMVFVPSKGGISHSFDEDTTLEDIVAGAHAVALAVEKIAINLAAL